MKDLIARYDAGVRARIGEILANTKPLEGARPSVVRPRSEVAEDAAADHVPDDDAERRGELPRARGRNGRRRDDAGGRHRAGRCPAGHDERARNLGAQAGRQAVEPVHVLQVADDRDCRRRGDPPAGRPHQHRLGMRARRRHRPHGGPRADRARSATTSSDTRSRTTSPIAAAVATRGMAPTGCISKNHDTFAPMGPFIVPKEFVPNPQNLQVKFTLNGQVMQDANTSLMIHTVRRAACRTARTS